MLEHDLQLLISHTTTHDVLLSKIKHDCQLATSLDQFINSSVKQIEQKKSLQKN